MTIRFDDPDQRRHVVALVLCAGLGLAAPAAAEETEGTDPSGVLPALSALWFVPERLALRFPDAPMISDEPVLYDRKFPLFAQEAIDRGYALPKPYGISLFGVNNVQEQLITDLEVALGRGTPPPPGTELKAIPFVSLEDTISDTDSVQIKGDVWILPNVNLFGTLGRATGHVDLAVVVNPEDVLPPAACRPANPCDPVTAKFRAGVDTNTITLGATAVHGWGNWFTSGTVNGTLSFGDNTDYAIRSWGASGRLGRRFSYGRGNLAAPYLGVSYFDLDQVVEGVTRLPDAFPNGDSLEVRYKARTRNVDKWSMVAGVNLGFINGTQIAAEYGYSENSEKLVLSATYRY